ncbi:hypothetical protein [Marinicella sp. W31]|uniref:hypothetical protein n=1 Tax=Marinicella sp. W31 TaxID=3023713 RepID=UPI003757B6BF
MIDSIKVCAVSALLLCTHVCSAQLPPDPEQWVCADPKPTPAEVKQWCDDNLPGLDMKWREQTSLTIEPGQLTNLEQKNAYDAVLNEFLISRTYDTVLKWPHDKNWRLTGPYVGPIGSGESYGVHPAVRVYYSPEVAKWLCDGREGELPEGSMLIKEMHDIDQSLGVKYEAPENCMSITNSSKVQATSWTVMVKSNQTFDGWYWANPSANPDINQVIADKSAFDKLSSVPSPPVSRNADWYPTGYVFSDAQKIDTVVYPYSLFGAACINCHASAVNEMTFSSLDNVLTSGLGYRHYAQNKAKSMPLQTLRTTLHSQELAAASHKKSSFQSPFSQPLKDPDTDFVKYFGNLGVDSFAKAWGLRFPAETYDHHLSSAQGPDQFITSDQCINCHDATYANSAEANMLINKAHSEEKINVSPYGEWRVSPMGLAGRDPIFFSQLQSETNNLPELTKCIENTCLHCHGVMGQRQQAIDTEPSDECKDIFAIQPPEGVPFGTPFAKETVTSWQVTPDNTSAKYGALARDGISCAVCHHVDKTALGEESSYTGNFVTGSADEIYGPYEKVITKPMQHALGITPQHGEQITSSEMCGTCHNILLPTYNNDGTLHKTKAPNGQMVTATYEQTTHLEWLNSDFAKPDTFQSCQDCHMPKHFKVGDTYNPLKGIKIANIQSADLPPTTNRLPTDEVTLTPRDEFSRHALHGLNVFINEMFQQFPMILGLRQMDYMVNANVQPSLITGRDSMLEMARHQTVKVSVEAFKKSAKGVELEVKVSNETGHFMPSGVGFRRAFLEVVLYDKDNRPIWASGRTNKLGVIVDGTTDKPLKSEQGGKGVTAYQPHYELITQQDQVQIYQEVIADSEGHLTTSFMRRVKHLKDNRIRTKGFDPKKFLRNKSPYIQIVGELVGKVENDPYYYKPDMTGADVIRYQPKLSQKELASVNHVTVRMYNQSIPPAYLQDRFSDAKVGPAKKDDIQRLFYITSHLNTNSKTAEGMDVIQDWKLYLSGACMDIHSNTCQ